MRTRSAHPASRPLPFRSLQELRRHLNCCFQLIYFYHNFKPNAIPPTGGSPTWGSAPIMTVTYELAGASLPGRFPVAGVWLPGIFVTCHGAAMQPEATL